jgi:hypothetical protein
MLTGAFVIAQQRPLRTGVKKIDREVSCSSYEGVVDKIDADEVILVEKLKDNLTRTRRFVPVDLLREGKYIFNQYDGANAYLWKDVKKGDTVRLEVLMDEGDGLTYCLQISIRRRLGEKLPESQNPKKDRWYNANRVLNEIENGNDVSDEELLKTWPPEHDRESGLDHPGGLTKTGWMAKYSDMLDANRKRIAEEKAKKEKDLKAKPADKK